MQVEVGSPVPERPLLKPWYRLAWTDDAALLHHGSSLVELRGRAVESLLRALLPLLDGTRSVDAVVGELGEPIRPAVEQALELLSGHGVLADGTAPEAEFLAALHPGPVSLLETANSLAVAAVGVLGSSEVASEAGALLSRSGTGRVSCLGWPESDGVSELDLVVVAPSGEELPRLEGWNREALELGIPWLQVLPYDGRLAAVGPLYVPGESACYECYRLRCASNVPYRREFWELEAVPAHRPSAPAFDALLAGCAATLALRWVAGREPSLPGVLHAVELRTGIAVEAHLVYRVPRCPACSGLADLASPFPWFVEAEHDH